MRNLKEILKNRTIDYEKLIKYGFVKDNGVYIYKEEIYHNQFEVNIFFSEEKQYSKLMDIENNEEYALVDIDDSVGEFIGKLKEEYECIIEDIINNCTNKEIFKSSQAIDIINYIKKKYNDELEFLWEKFDDNAIWRNKQNNKWYGALLIVEKSKIGIEEEGNIEIIDLRYQKEQIEEIIDNKNTFPGYHMNKKSWITIKLDNSVDTKTIYNLIDNSYNLSIGNKCGFTGDTLSQK